MVSNSSLDIPMNSTSASIFLLIARTLCSLESCTSSDASGIDKVLESLSKLFGIGNNGSGLTRQIYLYLVMKHFWTFIIVAATLSLLICTYLTTLITFECSIRNYKLHGGRPPILPYWIPYIGSVLPFLFYGPDFVTNIVKKFGHTIPIGIQLGPRRAYLVSDPKLSVNLFKANPGLSTATPLPIAMRYIFGTPEHIIPVYAEDNSGPLPKPVPGTQIPPKRRIRFQHWNAAHKFLVGTSGIRQGEIYSGILHRNILADRVITSEWLDLPDLHEFLQQMVFPAGIESFFGSHILSLNPTLVEDYFTFAQGVPKLLRGYPRWLVPTIYRNRNHMLKSMKKWHAFAKEHEDFSKIEPSDPDWEENFGSKYIKARQHFLHQIDTMDDDGRASEDLGIMFGATANALAVAFWAVFHVLSSSQLVSRVRDCSEAGQIQESQTLDGTKLIRDPLMQSIFAEATRICVNGLLPMTAEKDIDVGRWSIPRGSIILISSIIGATNPDVWNAGSQEEPHPLDRFWADRFVIYPDDPNSGPLRNPRKPSATREQQNEHASSNSITEIKEPTFSVKGLSGSYLPFGDGSIKCPGRDFARAEVICTLAQLLLNYDMELRVPEGWEPKMDTNWFPLGALPPVDKVPFRIRRRL